MLRNKYARFFIAFLTVNAVCWTIIPAWTRKILPMDTLEAIVWGSGWSFGNGKHPPLSGWIAEFFYTIFGHADFSQYLLSQLLVIAGSLAVYALSRKFLSREEAVVGSLTLFCIYFYNFTTPEYNVNVLEIAFWPLTALVFYRAVQENKLHQWLLFGKLAAVVMWTKYFSGLLLFTFFIYMLIDPQARSRFRSRGPYLAIALFALLYLPHLIWLHLHGYAPVLYAMGRTGSVGSFNWANYLVNLCRLIPLTVGVLLPAMIVLGFSFGSIPWQALRARLLGSWGEDEAGRKYLLTLLVVPLLVMQLLAIAGVGIRSMWYSPVFFAAGPLFVLFFRPWFAQFHGRRFAAGVAAVGVLLLAVYAATNLIHTSRRVHFPADELCRSIHQELAGSDKPVILLGDYWTVGMLHCYLPDHPVAINGLDRCWQEKTQRALEEFRAGKAVLVFAVSTAAHQRTFEQLNRLKMPLKIHSFTCQAPFGKAKKAKIGYAVLIPPAKK